MCQKQTILSKSNKIIVDHSVRIQQNRLITENICWSYLWLNGQKARIYLSHFLVDIAWLNRRN